MPKSTSTSSSSKPICEICSSTQSKYKCPQCSIQTCSLNCVQTHKLVTKCIGQRIKTKYIPMENYTENTLFSDYSFLEEVGRVNDVAARVRINHPCSVVKSTSPTMNPKQQQILANAASKSNINLLFLPKGMTRSTLNQSFHDLKTKTTNWSMELDLSHLSVCKEHAPFILASLVPDTISINDLMQQWSDPASHVALAHPNIHVALTPYLQTPLFYYWKLPHAPVNQDHPRQVHVPIVDLTLCIKSLLNAVTVLEFPTLVVTQWQLPNHIIVNEPSLINNPQKIHLPSSENVISSQSPCQKQPSDVNPSARTLSKPSPWALDAKHSALLMKVPSRTQQPSINTLTTSVLQHTQEKPIISPVHNDIGQLQPTNTLLDPIPKSPWTLHSTVGTPNWPKFA